MKNGKGKNIISLRFYMNQNAKNSKKMTGQGKIFTISQPQVF